MTAGRTEVSGGRAGCPPPRPVRLPPRALLHRAPLGELRLQGQRPGPGAEARVQAPDHRPAKQDVHPGVEDLVPGGHAQVNEQLLLGGSGQLPGRAHGGRAAQHRLGDEDLPRVRAVSGGRRRPPALPAAPAANPPPTPAEIQGTPSPPCCVTWGGLPDLSELQWMGQENSALFLPDSWAQLNPVGKTCRWSYCDCRRYYSIKHFIIYKLFMI